ncbi:metal ABC transporter substrate-binding protein [Philodulcilactobacillus myokoensis]|uniref:Metal ABC transporter substrate-binding protein n=1 Tax=Philodulcilactobacillus myokoensis TaxID=2929573 RepID=A0A9W6ES58_9LACO|nr:metal ABC transporter substrate-binding protein [Philodulcilactobacillus myokoensis]
MKKHLGLKILALAVLSILILTGCSSKSAKNKGINVTSSIDFYGNTAQSVLGKYGTVHSIINNPDVDPHSYTPTPQVSESVAKSKDVIYNGIGYDTWINKMLNNSNNDSVNVGKLMGKGDNDNPHIWYNSQTMVKLANTLADKFGKQDPKHKAQFKANAKKYINSLKPIHKKIAQLKQNRKKSVVDVSEPVFDYALQEMGYQVNDSGFAKAIEKEADPTPSEIKGIQNDINHHKIAFFVKNIQTDDKVVNHLSDLAAQKHIPVLKVTESMPRGMNYQQWMMSQYNQLAKIQRSETK